MRKKNGLVITVKDIIGIVIALLTGAAIGYFGVLGSLSGAVNPTERLNVIGVISLIYFAVGAVLGVLLPHYSWKWGLFLSLPGILLLGSSLVKNFNSSLFIYLLSILLFSCLGAWDGALLRKRREKGQPQPLTKKQRKAERRKKAQSQPLPPKSGQTKTEQSGAGPSAADQPEAAQIKGGPSKKNKTKKKQRKR
jgi:hypothetical protein